MLNQLGTRPALDGVRALAIAGVVALHVDERLAPGGGLGVDLFFTLSAFLISCLIMDEVEQSHDRRQFDFRGFYWRRFFRLAPALLLWLATLAPLTAARTHEGGKIAASSALSLFYVGDFGMAFTHWMASPYAHVWSLAIEEQFYFVWPALLVLIVRWRRRRTFIVVLLAASVLVDIAAEHHFSGAKNYFLPTGHLVSVMAGAFAADVFTYRGERRWVRWLSRPASGAAAILVAAGLFVGYGHAPYNVQRYAVPLVIAAVGFTLVLHAASATGAIVRVLSARIPRWIGQRSYGLYLYHRTITILIPTLWHGVTLKVAAPVGLVASLGVAEASFRWVEGPIRRGGRRWLETRGEAAHTGDNADRLVAAESARVDAGELRR